MDTYKVLDIFFFLSLSVQKPRRCRRPGTRQIRYLGLKYLTRLLCAQPLALDLPQLSPRDRAWLYIIV